MNVIENIESKFLFSKKIENYSFIQDSEGKLLAFSENERGNKVVLTQDLDGVEVAIEHCIDGTKIFHLEKDSKGLPAMHEFKPDGTEIIYLFDKDKKLEKAVTSKTNGDKLTEWFSSKGDLISQEQRQNGQILFKIDALNGDACVLLHPDGEAESYGDEKFILHLIKVFNKYLDGLEL